MRARNRNKRLGRAPRPRFKSRSRKPGWVGSSFVAVVLAAGLVAGCWAGYPYFWAYVSHPDRFRIEKVTFEGNVTVGESELRLLLPRIEGVNLFAVDLKMVKERLCQHPWVSAVSLHRRLPHGLLIRIFERKPVAIVNTDRLWAVDVHGIVLPLDNWPDLLDLPIVRLGSESRVTPGKPLADEGLAWLLAGLESLRRRLPDLWGEISEVYRDEEHRLFFVAFSRPTTILLGQSPTWRQLLNFYSFLMYHSGPSGLDDVNFVDLTFPGQVIIRRDQSRRDCQVQLAT